MVVPQCLRHPIVTATLVCSAWVALPTPARAEPDVRVPEIDGLKRNGQVSRHVWAPRFAAMRIGGVEISPGIALGLREQVRSQLGVPAAPALSAHLTRHTTLSLLAGGNGGMMLVLQAQP